MAEKSSWDQANRRQKLGLVWRNRKKISQIIKDNFYLPFFFLIILWSWWRLVTQQADELGQNINWLVVPELYQYSCNSCLLKIDLFILGRSFPQLNLNDICRNSLLGNRKKIAKFLMRTFTCRSTFLYDLNHTTAPKLNIVSLPFFMGHRLRKWQTLERTYSEQREESLQEKVMLEEKNRGR